MRCHLQISSYRIDLTSVNGPIYPKQCYYEMDCSFYSFYWLGSLEIWLDHNSIYYRSLSKNSDVKRRISYCDPPNLQYNTHPEFWPSHGRIFKTSLYHKSRLILKTRPYVDTLDSRFIFYIDRQHLRSCSYINLSWVTYCENMFNISIIISLIDNVLERIREWKLHI